jgi:phosphatidylglycerol:prolipoprotein diacylglycerol transferase
MIEIGMGPNIIDAGSFVLSWHGLLSVIAVAMAVYLVGRWAPRHGISADDVYSTAIWAIIGGILGARLVHVVDEWSFYAANPTQIFAIWSGGIAIWGAVLGGFSGGWIFASWKGLPRGRLADITAPVLALSMAVGRIGDIVNGEHIASPTSLPWGFIWTHPSSPTFQRFGEVATHPAVVYEMLLDLAIVALLVWVLRKRLGPDGMQFAAFLALYSLGRFFILFLHEYKTWFLGLNEAQVISLLVLSVMVPLLIRRARLHRSAELAPVQGRVAPRSERRRSTRH